ANIDFRRACSYGVDYEDYLNRAWNNLALQGRGPIPRGMFGFDDSLFQFQYDIEKAVGAWNSAMENGLDTIFADNDYRLELYYPETGLHGLLPDILESLKMAIMAIMNHEQAKELSQPLIITKVSMSFSEYMERFVEGVLPVIWSSWAPDYDDPDNYVMPYARSDSVFASRIGYEDPDVDGWIRDAAKSHDCLERAQFYSLIQNALVEAVAYLWLAQVINFHVESAYLHGYIFNPLRCGTRGGGQYFYNYWKELPPVTSSIKLSEWWRNEFGALFSSAPSTYSETYLQSLVDKIARSSEVFSEVTTCSQVFAILSMDSTNGVDGLAKRELYALWLNLADRALTADTVVDLGRLTEATLIREVLVECELTMTGTTAPRFDVVRVVRICLNVNTGKLY
ncbi:MAG: ABC transporter substrate-binding protein, partial [Candidatus Thorarchaeota archaeon]